MLPKLISKVKAREKVKEKVAKSSKPNPPQILRKINKKRVLRKKPETEKEEVTPSKKPKSAKELYEKL